MASVTTKTEKTGVVEHDELANAAPERLHPEIVNDGDLGAKWLASYDGPRPELDDEMNRRIRNKIDKHLLPLIFVIYWTQQLDKSSLSFSSVFGLSTDAHLQGTDYSWLSSIVYFAQLVFQPLSVYALVKFPVNRWICFCFFGWGASLCIMSAFTSFAGLAAFRFILGAFEASIAPSMLVVVSMWWTRREQPLRNNFWYSANGMATILGSLFTYGLGHTKTKLYSYQLIFLVCGVIAVACSIPTFFLFPGHPTKVKWLTDEEKYASLERIRLNNTGTQNTHFKREQMIECFLDPKSWIFVVMVFCISFLSGGIGTFGPLILQGFGLGQFQTILYNMIPGGISIFVNITSAIAVMKFKRKSPILLVATMFPLAGAAALFALPRGPEHKSSLLSVYYILQVFQCITPLIFSWAFANTAGHTKKTTTTGMLYIGLTVGNIGGPFVYKKAEAPEYHSGLTANLIVVAILFGLIILQAFYLHTLNLRNVKRRIAAGKTGVHVDYSLENSSNWAKIKEQQRAAELEAATATGGDKAVHEVYNENAFADMTDRQNYDFVYSL